MKKVKDLTQLLKKSLDRVAQICQSGPSSLIGPFAKALPLPLLESVARQGIAVNRLLIRTYYKAKGVK